MRSATPMFKGAGDKLTHEGNWDFFRESAPGNLKFLELIYLQDPDNLELLSVVIKGHSGYAFAVPETLALGDELAGKFESPWKERAIYHYNRSLDYGFHYLAEKGIPKEELLKLDEKKLAEKLQAELGKDDTTAVLYTAQAWGSLINLQKDNIALVAQVPKVKALFDWVCKVEPEIDNGVCDIFYAQYEASRPRMLGGNPERAEKLYVKAAKARPYNLLIPWGRIEYMVLPAMDGEKYEEIASGLRQKFAEWEKSTAGYAKRPELNLYNAIAKKRFELIEKYKNEIF